MAMTESALLEAPSLLEAASATTVEPHDSLEKDTEAACDRDSSMDACGDFIPAPLDIRQVWTSDEDSGYMCLSIDEDEEVPAGQDDAWTPPPSKDPTGERMCSFGKGLQDDFKVRLLPYYTSDWARPRSFLTLANAIIFAFVVQLIPALIFADLLERQTQGHLGVAETILSTAIIGIIYAIAAGQPLVILGVTGPVAILLGTFTGLMEQFKAEFFAFFFWSCIWAGLLHIAASSVGMVNLVWKVVKWYTAIQLAIAIMIWAVAEFATVGFVYPLLLTLLVPFRSFIITRMFRQSDLQHLLDPYDDTEEDYHDEQRAIRQAKQSGEDELFLFPTRAEFRGGRRSLSHSASFVLQKRNSELTRTYRIEETQSWASDELFGADSCEAAAVASSVMPLSDAGVSLATTTRSPAMMSIATALVAGRTTRQAGAAAMDDHEGDANSESLMSLAVPHVESKAPSTSRLSDFALIAERKSDSLVARHLQGA